MKNRKTKNSGMSKRQLEAALERKSKHADALYAYSKTKDERIQTAEAAVRQCNEMMSAFLIAIAEVYGSGDDKKSFSFGFKGVDEHNKESRISLEIQDRGEQRIYNVTTEKR